MPLDDATREKVFAAERGIAGIRVAIIVLNSLAYVLLLDPAGTVPQLALGVIVAANAYGLYVLLAKPYRRFPAMLSSYFTTALDAAFITLWLGATGGFESPFYLLWMVSVAAVAFRYGPRETIAAGAIYVVCYLGLLAAMGELAPHAAQVLVRVAYVGFTAAIGALIAGEVATQTRAKVALRDLTAALKESEERFRRLSDAAFEGIAIHEHGTILECNRAFAELFGRAPHETVGRTAFDLLAPESHPVIAERLRRAADSPYEAVGLRRDGTRFDVELVGSDFPYRGRMVRVVAARDVTERRRAERAMRERASLQAMNEHLKEVDRMKTQFINNAAHELGTPLTPIKIQGHLLKTGALGPLTDRQQKALAILSRNVEQLSLLIRDVLDSSRLQAGKLHVEARETDLVLIAREAVESFHEAALEQGVELSFDGPPTLPVQADRARLTQVLFNMIHNALKFTPKGGSVRVRATREGALARVEVVDDGAGIAPEDVAKLFRPFSQVHDKMQATRSGTGLGLFISRGIIEQHGGAIGARSEGRGKGSTFWFTVPAPPGVSPAGPGGA